MINKNKFIHLIRQRNKTILQEFDNLYYYRPIVFIKIALIIESIEEVEPILIPNFLIPFKEEGVTETEKKEQYEDLKKMIVQKSKTSPIILGCRLDWLEEIDWLYQDLQENTKNPIF